MKVVQVSFRKFFIQRQEFPKLTASQVRFRLLCRSRQNLTTFPSFFTNKESRWNKVRWRLRVATGPSQLVLACFLNLVHMRR